MVSEGRARPAAFKVVGQGDLDHRNPLAREVACKRLIARSCIPVMEDHYRMVERARPRQLCQHSIVIGYPRGCAGGKADPFVFDTSVGDESGWREEPFRIGGHRLCHDAKCIETRGAAFPREHKFRIESQIGHVLNVIATPRTAFVPPIEPSIVHSRHPAVRAAET